MRWGASNVTTTPPACRIRSSVARRPAALAGKNPQKLSGWSSEMRKPLTLTAAVSALGPGTGITRRPRAQAR